MIKIGTVITLEPKNSNTMEKYKCKIVGIKNDHQIYIDYPINLETNRTVFLLDGSQLKVNFVNENNIAYMFESEVVGREKQNIPMLVLYYPGDEQLIKIQRREFVRIEAGIDVAVHSLNGEFAPFTTVTDDISAGGAAIMIRNPDTFKSGMIIETWFVLPMLSGEYHYLKLRSKIIRITNATELYKKMSLQFLETDSNIRQLLLRYCFERQVAQRKKGLE